MDTPNFLSPIEIIAEPNITNLGKAENLTSELIRKIKVCEAATWPEPSWQISEENIKNRANSFAEGFIVCSVGDEVAGFSTAMILDYDDTVTSWFQATDNGTANNHDSDGSHYYIISVTVSPNFQGRGIGGKLLKAHIKLARNLNKPLVICPRVEMSEVTEGNVEAEITKKPKISFYLKNGFAVNRIYVESDQEIQGEQYGVELEHNS